MSISDAPLAIASFVSNTFVAVVLYPFGKPITVQIGSFPSTYSTACFTYAAGIHAEAVSYLIPSSRIVLMSSHVAVCVNNVWSTIFKTSLVFIISCLSFFIHCDRFTNFQFV